MPACSGIDVRTMRPRDRSGSLRATSSATTVLSGNAAVARPAIAGARAEGVVIQALAAAGARGQAALLGVLERLATPRSLSAEIACLAAPDPTVATAAVAAVRPHLVSDDPDVASLAL